MAEETPPPRRTVRGSSGWATSGPPRMHTLSDLAASNPSPSRRRNDEDSDGQQESWFAGGERSGISVANPDHARSVPGGNTVRDIIRRAAEAGPPPDPASTQSGAFSGGAYKLGSDEVESSYIPDPNAPAGEEETHVIRHITFWRDGFSVEDGELLRYDAPGTEQLLAEINSGMAPPQILNVPQGQPVDVRVHKRLNENYTPSKRVSAFSGTGMRLGAPVPTVSGSDAGRETMPGAFPSGSGTSAPADRTMSGTRFEVDQTLPTTSVQIRLADGTRLVCRMNLTHTVLDLRNFINASRPDNLTRSYVIATTFPNRVLEDDTATIEGAGLQNSVIVQRWA